MLSTYVFLTTFFSGLNEKRKSEEGATAVEYGLLVALIAAIIVGLVATLGTQIEAGFQTIVDELPGGTT